jgi:putative ABC transport system substrate-binding protein
MNRRTMLFALLALLAPGAVFAQSNAAMPVIGFLSSRSPAESTHLVAAFKQGLAESGYAEGKNVAIDYRWAGGQYDRLAPLAAELVARQVTVIATVGGTVSALAARKATTRIPIVFLSGGDLVKLGLVKSLNRPGGNITGVSQFTVQLVAKRLELLHEISPGATLVGLLTNPKNPNSETELAIAKEASGTLGISLVVLLATTESQLDAAFATLAKQKGAGLVITADPFLDGRRAQAVALAAKYSMPTVYATREHAAAGGLLSYGPSFADTYREAGAYVGKVLKGDKPADMPVLQPTKFELVVNMSTAKAFSITIPQSVLVRADEVIQ